MNGITKIFFFLVILKRLNLTRGLVESSQFADNVIITNEQLIRNTFNTLLSILNIAPETDPKLERHLSIHKYLLSVTVRESETLNDIVRATRLFPVKDNETDYVDLMNDILNDGVNNTTEPLQDEQTPQVINNFISELEYLKSQLHSVQDIDMQLFESLKPIHKSLGTVVEEDQSSLEYSFENYNIPYWTPDDELELASSRRIYRGKGTKIKYFPFVASVLLFQMFYCAGSILSSDIVITAASCLQLAWNNRFFRENPAFVSVRVGSSFHLGGGEVIPVQEIYFHPSYEPRTLHANLCLLRLTRHLKFSGKKKRKIKKIMYDTNAHALPMNTPGVTIVGWGSKQASNVIHFDDPIHYAILDIYSLEDCQDVYTKEYVQKKNFCAGFISVGGGACNHDVGNPGIVGGVLVGVASFGSPVCGTPDAPTVFTKVGFYSDWIEEILEMDVPIAFVRTTTQEPWTSPTFPTISTTSKMPFPPPPLLDMLRLYLNQDESLYDSFVKVISKPSSATTVATQVTTTRTEKSTFSRPLSDEEEVKDTVTAAIYVDSFEKHHKEKLKKKRYHKKRKHIHGNQILTTTSIYENSKQIEDNYEIDWSREDTATIIRNKPSSKRSSRTPSFHRYPFKKRPLHKVVNNSIKHLTPISDYEKHLMNMKIKKSKKIYTKKEPTTTDSIDWISIQNEITPFHATTFNYRTHTTRNEPDFVDLMSRHIIEKNNSTTDEIKNHDQVQAAEEFFTHSILEYLAHTQLKPSQLLNTEDKVKSKSVLNHFERAKSLLVSDSYSDVSNESHDKPIIKTPENEKQEQYVAYLKSLDPIQFYKLLSTAITEIEKELRSGNDQLSSERFMAERKK